MKGFLVFTFIIQVVVFASAARAQIVPESEAETKRKDKEKFTKDAEEIYRAVGIDGIVPFSAFYKTFVAYYTYYEKTNKKALLTFFNYSIPNKEDRLVTIEFDKKTKFIQAHAGHGINSSADPKDPNRPCQQIQKSIELDGRTQKIKICENSRTSIPAVSFSNTLNSLQSSLGFIMAKNPGSPTLPVGKNLQLEGLESTNDQIANRGIYFHSGEGEISQGCIMVPQSHFNRYFEIIKGGTLIYAFQALASSSSTDVDEGELNRAIEVRKKISYAQSSDYSNVRPTMQEFGQTTLSQARPSVGAAYMGIGGPTQIPELLKGSSKYEVCQKLSDSSWSDTVSFINAGGDPSERFRGSWTELNQYVIDNAIQNQPAVELAEQRVATINDCVAMAHISNRTNFSKPNINMPEKKSSTDGSITCVYNGPESQDYQACLRTIEAQNILQKAEADTHLKQEENFKNSAEKRVAQVQSASASGYTPSSVTNPTNSNQNVSNTKTFGLQANGPDFQGGNNAQFQALGQASSMISDHSNVAVERANISQSKLDQLMAIASQIPTSDSLYDECSNRFAKHGTVSINEYNEFAHTRLEEPKSFQAERDYCQAAVSKQVNPIHNQPAREEIKKVLKSYGREVQEYTSKSNNLLQQTALSPSIDNSLFGLNLNGNGANFQDQFNTSGLANATNQDQGSSVLLGRRTSNGNGSSGLDSLVGGANIHSGVYDPTSEAAKKGKGFAGSDFSLVSNGYSGALRGTSSVGNGITGGIFDEEFYRKINLALEHPEQLDSLKLTPEQMKEYLDRKSYFDSMTNGEEVGRRAPASGTVLDFKDKTQLPINDKDLNIFDIISTRYAKKFF